MEPTNGQTPGTPGTEQVNVTPEQTPAAVTPATPEPGTTPTPAAQPQEPQTPASQPAEPDYKNKFGQSAGEALIFKGKAEKLEEQIKTLTSPEPPTEAELRAAYPNWDSMNAVEQAVFRDILTERKARRRLEATLLEMTAEQKFQAEKEALFRNPEYTALRGDAEFEQFVLKPKHKGIDIQTLADAYLFKKGVKEPQTPAPAAEPRDPGLPRGSGGPRTAEKPGLTNEEIAHIRQHDPQRFREMLKRGEIQLG